MIYCKPADVTRGNPDLQAAHVVQLLPDLISEACDTLHDQLSGLCDISGIEQTGPIPERIKRLAIYKARELGYLAYFQGETPERGPVQENRQIFETLLAGLQSDVKEGRLDMMLQPAMQENIREVRFL